MTLRRPGAWLVAAVLFALAAAWTPGALAADGPVDTMRRHYQAINRGNFGTAWSLLTSDTRADLGGYARWRSGFRTTLSVRVVRARLLERTPGTAKMTVRLGAVDRDACGRRVARVFAGRWSAVNGSAGWRLIDPRIRQVGGPPLVLKRSACPSRPATPPPPPTPPPAPPPASPSCDPNYSGACVPLVSYDLDCADIGYQTVYVVGTDVHRFDGDGDGVGCE